MKVDIGKECLESYRKYCIDRIDSITVILNRDRKLWGLPSTHVINRNIRLLNQLDGKTRNMVRKAAYNGVKIRKIDKNNYLPHIYEINISSPVRQEREMTAGYRQFPKYTEYTKCCDKHFWEFFGAFKDDRMIAYISVLSHKELVLISQILGHSNYQWTGVMNGILYYVIETIKSYAYAKVIQYDFWNSGTDGLRHFKKSMGFVPIELEMGE